MLAPVQVQLQFEAPQPASDGAARWFGRLDRYERLFDGLEDEWLRPPEGQTGIALSARSMAVDHGAQVDDRAESIEVGLRVEFTGAPPARIFAYRSGAWESVDSAAVPDDCEAIWWPGPLPVSLITEVCVDSADDKARLELIASATGNLRLPAVLVEPSRRTPTPMAPTPPPAASGFPPGYDGTRGAAAMAWWGIPRTRPWFDLLVAAFSPSDARLAEQARQIGAPWLCHLPWRPAEQASEPLPLGEALWRGAIEALRAVKGSTATELVDALRAAAARRAPREDAALAQWATETHDILRGDRRLMPDPAACPVGTAIRLVLTRSTPGDFESWSRESGLIPPAVWWSGAILCGLLTGYRALPTPYRGHEGLRRFLALRLADADGGAAPGLEWRRRDGRITFARGGEVMLEKHETRRGAWFEADLDDDDARSIALGISQRNDWPVHSLTARVSRDQYSATARGRDLVIEAEAFEVSHRFSAALFQRALATRPGAVTTWPPAKAAPRAATPAHMVPPNVPAVPGLIYVPAFIDSHEEERLLAAIDAGDWSDALKRRTQHYGWRYDYKASTIAARDRIGPLPVWADALARRLRDAGLLPWIADQVIVNEYVGRQGIQAHTDHRRVFEGPVATLSLNESWSMRFHPPEGQWIDHRLERGSVAVLTGEVRARWKHGIPLRKYEARVPRGRRLSLTFRKVCESAIRES